MMQERKANPFQAPAARVADAAADPGELIENGQRVPVGNGVAWIGRGWQLFRMAPGTWIGITVVFILIVLAVSFVPLLNLLSSLIMPIFAGGLMLGCRALEEGDSLEFAHLFAGFRMNTGNLVLVGVLYLVGAIVIAVLLGLVAAVTFGGAAAITGMQGEEMGAAMVLPMMLLVLLGMALFIPLIMAFWFAPALVVLHDVPAFPAMRMSFFACLKNFLPFLLYGIVLTVLTVIAMLPLLLGLLVLWPVMWASMYASYRDMFVQE
jgi:uncharacterized membrane protein